MGSVNPAGADQIVAHGQGSSIYTSYLFRIGESYEQGMDRWIKLKKAGAEHNRCSWRDYQSPAWRWEGS